MGHKICKKCGKKKTYPEFKFLGKGKYRKRIPGSARSDTCIQCGGNKNVD